MSTFFVYLWHSIENEPITTLKFNQHGQEQEKQEQYQPQGILAASRSGCRFGGGIGGPGAVQCVCPGRETEGGGEPYDLPCATWHGQTPVFR